MERGYVRSYRKKIFSDLWVNKNAFRVFEFLLHSATYRPHKYFAGGTCIELQPGQYISSERVIAKRCFISYQQSRSAIDYLKVTQRINTTPTQHYTLYSIINWDVYQNIDETYNAQLKDINNAPITHGQRTDNAPITQKQEVKKERRKEGKKKPTSFVLPDSIRPEVWEAFEEHRRKKRSPMTDHARELMVKACEEIGGDPNVLLENAIVSGWQKVYPLKEGSNGSGTKGQHGQHPTDGGPKAEPGKYDNIPSIVAEAK